MADIYFESDWIDTSCSGPPDLMSTYTADNASDVYNYIQGQFSYPACGMDPVARPVGCCYSSLKRDETFGLQGMAIHLLDNSLTENLSPPASANGNTYCLISSNGTLHYTYSMYVLQSGQCNYGYMCDQTSVSIYDNSSCTGIPLQLSVQNNQILWYNTTNYGEVSVEFRVISGCDITFGWEGLIPGNLLVPDHRYTLDKLALIGYVFAILGSIVALVIYYKKILVRRSLHNVLGFSSQIAWIVEHVQTLYLDYVLFPTQYSVLVYQAVFSYTSIASLLTVLIAIDLITKLFYSSPKIRKIAFCLTVFVHLALVGWTYLAFLAITNPDLFNIMTFTLGMLPVSWHIIMLIVDLFPPFIVLYKITVNSSHLERKLERWHIEVMLLVMVHLLNTIVYGILGYLGSETEFFQNDRSLQSLWGIARFQFMLNYIIVLRFNVYLKMLLKKSAHSSYGSKQEKSIASLPNQRLLKTKSLAVFRS
ncbi:hypothetical protein HK103_001438 [Boothiomyces macroporosus]|uniref:Uncharacterized protein n=1 Tax=Boothiomyces macroporosus TaxID=261099 RepID=A0AAD5UAB2_9FUNG|nr:hypothetical protein HK103_001438 [Boothiomyces macroporosus]